MAIAEDASAPAAVTNTANAALTTASFTPPAGSLIVAVGNVGNNTGSGTLTGTVTDSISSTWTLLKRASGGNGGSAEIWVTDAATATARTVTWTPATAANGLGNSLCVKVLTGALPAATCLGASTTALNTTAYGISITPTVTGSLLVGALVDVIAAGALTVNGITTSWQSVNDSGDTEKYAAFRMTGLTSSLSAQTIGFSNTAGDGQNIAAVEIKPAPWVLVQSCKATSVIGTTISKAFGSNVTSGNRIILYTSHQDSSTTGSNINTPTDNQGNTYTKLVEGTVASTTNFQYVAIWTTVPASTGTLTITVTCPAGTGAELGFTAEEYSGLDSSAGAGCLDVSAAGTGNAANSNNADSGTTAASHAANQLAVSVVGDWGAGATWTVSSGTGFTKNTAASVDADTNQGIGAGNRTSASGTAEHCVWTMGGSLTDTDVAVVAVIKLAGGAAVPAGVLPHAGGQQWRRRFRHRQALLPAPVAAPSVISVTAILTATGTAGVTPVLNVDGLASFGSSAGAGGVSERPTISILSPLTGAGGASGGTLLGAGALAAGTGSATAGVILGVTGSANGQGSATALPGIGISGSLNGQGSASSGTLLGAGGLAAATGTAGALPVISVGGLAQGQGGATAPGVIGGEADGRGTATAGVIISVTATLTATATAGALPVIQSGATASGQGGAGSGAALGTGGNAAGQGSATETPQILVTGQANGAGTAGALPRISVTGTATGQGSANGGEGGFDSGTAIATGTATALPVIAVTATLTGTGGASGQGALGGVASGVGTATAVPTVGAPGSAAGTGSDTAVPDIQVGGLSSGTGGAGGSGQAAWAAGGTAAGTGTAGTLPALGAVSGTAGAAALAARAALGALTALTAQGSATCTAGISFQNIPGKPRGPHTITDRDDAFHTVGGNAFGAAVTDPRDASHAVTGPGFLHTVTDPNDKLHVIS